MPSERVVLAATHGDVATLRTLSKAEIEKAVNRSGLTAVHIAVAEGHMPVLVLCAELGILNTVTNTHETALHWCCKNGKLFMTAVLFHLGANPRVASFVDKTPIDCAREHYPQLGLLLDVWTIVKVRYEVPAHDAIKYGTYAVQQQESCEGVDVDDIAEMAAKLYDSKSQVKLAPIEGLVKYFREFSGTPTTGLGAGAGSGEVQEADEAPPHEVIGPDRSSNPYGLAHIASGSRQRAIVAAYGERFEHLADRTARAHSAEGRRDASSGRDTSAAAAGALTKLKTDFEDTAVQLVTAERERGEALASKLGDALSAAAEHIQSQRGELAVKDSRIALLEADVARLGDEATSTVRDMQRELAALQQQIARKDSHIAWLEAEAIRLGDEADARARDAEREAALRQQLLRDQPWAARPGHDSALRDRYEREAAALRHEVQDLKKELCRANHVKTALKVALERTGQELLGYVERDANQRESGSAV